LFFLFFCCCAELSKSVLVHRIALSHWRPSTPNVPQRAEERPPPSSSPSTPPECILFIKRGAGALPVLALLLVSPHRHPGNRNLGSGKPRGPGFQDMFLYAGRLGWSIGIVLLFAICHPVTSCKPALSALHTPQCWASLSDFST
jgi:hypothetical protein